MKARGSYVHFQTLSTRWKDNDLYGHVNNVVYYSYFDTVINSWLIRSAGLNVHEGDMIGVCAASGCTFYDSISFPDIIDVGLRVTKLGTTSVHYELGVFKSHRENAVAVGMFVHVFVDRRSRRPIAIAEPLRQSFEGLLMSGDKP